MVYLPIDPMAQKSRGEIPSASLTPRTWDMGGETPAVSHWLQALDSQLLYIASNIKSTEL